MVLGSKDTGMETRGWEGSLPGWERTGKVGRAQTEAADTTPLGGCTSAVLRQDHSADLHLAAKCCSNQSALIPCQSLGNGGKVCRLPAHPDSGSSLGLAGVGPEGKGSAWLFGPRKAKDAEHRHQRLTCSGVYVQVQE